MSGRQAKKRARVLIVDDHPAVREALSLRIGRQPDLEVCGEAADMGEALRLLAPARPDVAVVDISLRASNGIELIKRIRDRDDRVRVLVWSMHGESLYAERALRAGALGYVNKDRATDTIVDAIRSVLEGKVWLSEAMANRLLQRTVGAYHTHGTGFFASGRSGMMTNAGCSPTLNAFLGGTATFSGPFAGGSAVAARGATARTATRGIRRAVGFIMRAHSIVGGDLRTVVAGPGGSSPASRRGLAPSVPRSRPEHETETCGRTNGTTPPRRGR
ncbi:MAG: response regulator transcription factor [Planctomycetes bacterium]|nr:response regulator transcription factor [Planctomycetota bacterium]